MKLTVTETVTQEIEVEGEFPLFRSEPPYYYKIMSLTEMLRVEKSPFSKYREVGYLSNKLIIHSILSSGVVISENTFVDEFVKAVHDINLLVAAPVNAVELAETYSIAV